MNTISDTASRSIPWNKGRVVGQKLPLKLKEIWAIRIRLQIAERSRDLPRCTRVNFMHAQSR